MVVASLHFPPAIYPIAAPDAILGNRSLRCSNSCIPAVVPSTSALHGWRKCKRIVRTILAMWSCGRGRGGTSSGSSGRATRQAGSPRTANPGLASRAGQRREASTRIYGVALEKWAQRTVKYACAHFPSCACLLRFAFHRCAVLLCSKGQGRPSVVCPLNGTKVHRTFVCFRFALLRLKGQGNPSVDFPFAGRIHALRSPCFAVAPAQAIRGLSVRRGEGPPDLRLLPPHPLDLAQISGLSTSSYTPSRRYPAGSAGCGVFVACLY